MDYRPPSPIPRSEYAEWDQVAQSCPVISWTSPRAEMLSPLNISLNKKNKCLIAKPRMWSTHWSFECNCWHSTVFFSVKGHLRGELKNFYSKILIVGVVSEEMRGIKIWAIPHADSLRGLDGIEAYVFLATVQVQ